MVLELWRLSQVKETWSISGSAHAASHPLQVSARPHS